MKPDRPRQAADQASQLPIAVADLRLDREAGPLRVAFRRSVSQEDTAAAGPVLHAALEAVGSRLVQEQGSPDDESRPCPKAAPAGLPDWRRLPGEILDAIFSGLSLDDQARCALVCRHWCRFVPQDRLRMATWLARCGPVLRKVQSALASARHVRAYPFLQACAPQLLHQVQRQEGSRWLPGSLLHALDHQLTAASRFDLTWVVSQSCLVESVVARPVFSSCGRDLVLLNKRRSSGPQRFYTCRETGQWHAWFESWYRPSCLVFDTLVDRCFFSGFADGSIQCQEYCEEDRPGWWRFILGTLATGSPVCQLFLTPGARYLVALSCCEQGETTDEITVFERTCAVPLRQTWVRSGGGRYSHRRQHLVDLAISPSRPQKVLCICERGSAEPSYRLVLCRPEPLSEPGTPWQHRPFPAHSGTALRILYSPDGNQLFVAMAEGQAAVWRVEADRLELQLTMTCHVHDGYNRVSGPVTIYNRDDLYGSWQPFSGDSRQLAVPVSPVAVQMWRCEAGHWTLQQSLDAEAGQDLTAAEQKAGEKKAGEKEAGEKEAGEQKAGEKEAGEKETGEQETGGRSRRDRARYTLLSANGRLLVLASMRQLSIWYWQEQTGWQLRLVRKGGRPSFGRPRLDAALLGGWSTHCLVVAGPQGTVALYGPDADDQLCRKAEVEVGEPVRQLISSADGLSFTTLEVKAREVSLWALKVPAARPCP